MRDYAEEGIRHFYFMMLQKDEVSEHRRTLMHLLKFPKSSLTRRKVEVLAALPTIVVIRTAMLQNGRLANMSEWESLPSEIFRNTKN